MLISIKLLMIDREHLQVIYPNFIMYCMRLKINMNQLIKADPCRCVYCNIICLYADTSNTNTKANINTTKVVSNDT